MTNSIDTPLTRLTKKHKAEMDAIQAEVDQLRLDAARVRGVNDLLKFELLEIESTVRLMTDQMNKVLEHVLTLKKGLPE